MERRVFIGSAVATATLHGVMNMAPRSAHAADAVSQMPPDIIRGEMRYRQLGKTGEEVSLLSLGGHHIGRQKDEKDSIRIIRTAIDAGINFLDNCWDYHDGVSEVRMGKSLDDGYRKKVLLMTKLDGRTKEAATEQLHQSLKRLQTDVIDLVQFHEIIRLEDPDRIFSEGGAMEALSQAKKEGKIRFIGFTGHKDPLVHLRMLDIAAERGFHFDAVQMPINVMDAHFRSFGSAVLPRLVKEQVGVLGMKSLADGLILKSRTVSSVECLHYAMSQPVSTVVSGMDSLEILKQNLDAIKTFKPLTDADTKSLLARTASAAATGRFETFKTTNGFDGTAQHPEWLGKPDKGPT